MFDDNFENMFLNMCANEMYLLFSVHNKINIVFEDPASSNS